jgi:hypothetical protein
MLWCKLADCSLCLVVLLWRLYIIKTFSLAFEPSPIWFFKRQLDASWWWKFVIHHFAVP